MMCQLKTKHIAIASSKYYVAIATYVCVGNFVSHCYCLAEFTITKTL